MPLFLSNDQAVVWYRVAIPKMTVFSLYAIHLFQCIDFLSLTDTRNEYKWGSAAGWKYISRVEELHPHVHNSIQEFLFMSVYRVYRLHLWSWGSPWNVLWSFINSRGILWSYSSSGVVLSLIMPPLSPFPGVCQGVSPVHCSCSQMIAHSSIALTLRSIMCPV